MPYVNNAIKASLVDGRSPMVAGELNFLISTMIDQFVTRRGLSYAVLNEAVGALECCKLEVYRRLCAPYEDKKMSENGDVFINV